METAGNLAHNYPAGVLIVGYGLASLCLAVYFMWEDGPFHRSRRVEHTYLTGILILVYITSFLWNRIRGLRDQADTVEALRQFMRLMLTVNIVQSFVRARTHPPFFSQECAKWRSRYVAQPPTLYAVRVSEELVKLIDKVSSNSRSMIIPPQALAPMLLILFMLEDIAWASPLVSRKLKLWPFFLDLAVLTYVVLIQGRRVYKLGPRIERIHEMVSEIVGDRDRATLRYVLASMSVGSLIEVGSADTFYALVKTALETDLLDLTSKAILLDALQKKGLKFSTKTQLAVKNLFLSCMGRDLTILKNLLDGSGTYQNLFKMIYTDLKSETIRSELLRHIEVQSEAVRGELGHAEGVKILSDIDDTLYSSGGSFPKGADKRFPKREIYPGCLHLFQLLDEACRDRIDAPSCNLVFVSARPHVYRGYAEDQSYRKFRKLVHEDRMHIMPTLLPGTLIAGSRSAFLAVRGFRRAWQPVAEQKFQTFRQYRALYSEYDFIFCGDNGQGDLLAGQHMMNEDPMMKPGQTLHGKAGGGPNTIAVLIHEVKPADDVLSLDDAEERGPEWRQDLSNQNIFLFRSYVGAAVALHLCKPEIVSAEDLLKICISTEQEFDRMRLMYYEWGERWVPAEEELRADLWEAARVLEEAGFQVPQLKQTTELLSTIQPVAMSQASSFNADAEPPGWNTTGMAQKTSPGGIEIEMSAFRLDRKVDHQELPSKSFSSEAAVARSGSFNKRHLARAGSGSILLSIDVAEVRRELRETAVQCRKTRNPDELGGALERARQAGLAEDEIQDAELLLAAVDEEREAARERAMQEVRDAVTESKKFNLDKAHMADAFNAKSCLMSAIAAAKAVGVPEAALLEAETRRRRIHNKIEDIRGAIRVFCRVRPLNSQELENGDSCITNQEDPMVLYVENNIFTEGEEKSRFCFDAVFTPGTQEEIFDSCRDLVQSAVDGYNVTIFAYGQTGAGKTHTMYGTPGQMGTTPRAVKELFSIVSRDEHRFDFTISASMLELYRNELVDLLSKSDPSKVTKKLNVHVDRSGMVQIDNLLVMECKTESELLTALDNGNKQRSVAATVMNSQSSRSHLMILIKVVSTNKETGGILQGKILMCDLAGSERLRNTNSGERQSEGIEINKSLSALGDVLEALTKGQKQIPYRNHKLTQVMQDSLGGTAKTLMILNCSPASSNVQDTLMTLKYGTRAKQITNSMHRAANNVLKANKAMVAFSSV